MKHLLATAALAALAFATPANAVTVTGTYSVSFTDPNTTTTVTTNLPTSFSMVLGAARSNFITINPGLCYSSCNPNIAPFSVTFNNLTVNGHNFGSFTEGGIFTANYTTQTDSVVWTGATVQSGFGLDQDGNVPLVFTKILNGGSFGTLDFNLIDGADWNVQTYAEAQLVAQTPLPASLPFFAAGLLGLGGLVRSLRKQCGVA
jgi:hypothetical protein